MFVQVHYVGVVVVGVLACVSSSVASGRAVVVLENVSFAVCSSCRSSSSLEAVVESRQGVAVVAVVAR